MQRFALFILGFLLNYTSIFGQLPVQVTFRYKPSSTDVLRAYLPGTFNSWGPNNNGRIQVDAASQMVFNDAMAYYFKQIQTLSGNRYEYKFHEQYNASGSQWDWFTDPINPNINYQDNNNSVLDVDVPMVFQMTPVDGDILEESRPWLTASLLFSDNDSLDFTASTITLDGVLFSTLENHVIDSLSLLHVRLPELMNGQHTLQVHLRTVDGSTCSRSSSFTVSSGDVYFLTPSMDDVVSDYKMIRWRIGLNPSAVKNMTLNQVGSYPIILTPPFQEAYEYGVNLHWGDNRYVISATDTLDQVFISDTLSLYFHAPQIPKPTMTFEINNGQIEVQGEALDPQDDTSDFYWHTQSTNPAFITGIDGLTDRSFKIDIPTAVGDYAFKLTVTDSDGHSNSTVNFFTILRDGSVRIPDEKTVPLWVQEARIYSMFIRGFSEEGTIQAATDRLDYIRDLGFNVIWVLPVMDVEGTLDQRYNIGYSIIDFYNVEPVYGSNDDFKHFVNRAHELGIRVILDMTPNHTSRFHSIATDVRSKKKFSRYYDFYQHEIIDHNTNGLGQSISSDGIVFYSGFSEALLNWNWNDGEARQYMLDVLVHWLREYDIDGYRLDVYWGPHRRYGRDNFDVPLREVLKSAKADILILGETNGTGSGSEVQYADRGGGMDMGYDWLLLGNVHGFPNPTLLDLLLYNTGFRPGPNSYFLRFLENHDEYRVAYRYQSVEKTIPVSTAIFMATGIPMIYQGQEVGMGFDMTGTKEFLARSTVDWTLPGGSVLVPHYQKLAQIRGQFPAFQQQLEDTNGDYVIDGTDISVQLKLSSTSDNIYVIGRPYADQNGLVLMNFSSEPLSFQINLNLDQWARFSDSLSVGHTFYVNNLYDNTSAPYTVDELQSRDWHLNPYEVDVYTISTTQDRLDLPDIHVGVEKEATKPLTFELHPNVPNPFNPRTAISYESDKSQVIRLEIFNIIGQRIRVLVNQKVDAGRHVAVWHGIDDYGQPVPSGIYLCTLRTGTQTKHRKITLLK